MSTNVIANLEPSEPPRSPVLLPSFGLHQSAENKNSVRMREISAAWEVSENSSPMKEEDSDNCTLDLSMHSNDWNHVKQYSKEDSFMSASTDNEDDKALEEDEENEALPHSSHNKNFSLNLSLDTQATDSNQPSSSLDKDPATNSDLSTHTHSLPSCSQNEKPRRNLSLDFQDDNQPSSSQDEGPFRNSYLDALNDNQPSSSKLDEPSRNISLSSPDNNQPSSSQDEEPGRSSSLIMQNTPPSFNRDQEPSSSESAIVKDAPIKFEFEDGAYAGPASISARSVKAESSAGDEINCLLNNEAAGEESVGLSVKTEIHSDDDVEKRKSAAESYGLNATKLEGGVASYSEECTSHVDTSVNDVKPVTNDSDISGTCDTVTSVTDDIDLYTDESTDVINVTEIENEDVINVTGAPEVNLLNNRRNSAEQEVVDVESYQPCVVDLTCEEEDDVDVVEVVEPVIFIGSERRRRRIRRRAPSPLLDVAVEEIDHGDLIDDDTNNNAVDNADNIWGVVNTPEIDLQNPNLTFGSLLEQAHIETVAVDDNQVQSPRSPPALRPRRERELRRSRRQRRSRSRSPIIFDQARANSPPLIEENLPHLANLVHALNQIMPDDDWDLPVEAPNQLPLGANHMVAQEHQHRIAQVPPRPPTSPPHVEQPTITCLVCLDSIATINGSSRTLCSTVCGHVFCSACIKEVVKQRKQCPVCRKRLTKKQYHPLFI